MEKKEKEKRLAFFGESINRPFTKAEKQDRIDFYAKSGIELKFSENLIEIE